MNDTEKMFDNCFRYQKVILEWILNNMKENVIKLITKTPAYDIERHKLYSKNVKNNFDYIRLLLINNEIKYCPFDFDYMIFLANKEHPNRLSYWVYPDLYCDKIKCIDIPGEYLILMLCADMSYNIVSALYDNNIKRRKLHTIIERHKKERPWYKKYLSEKQHLYFKNFIDSLSFKVKHDKYFDNNIFNLKKVELFVFGEE